MAAGSLPIIDIAHLWRGDPAGREAVAQVIGEACAWNGFFYVVGAPGLEASGAAVLEQSRRLFALSSKAKGALAKQTPAGRGYKRLEVDASGDGKEEFYLGRDSADDPNHWPPGDEAFRRVMAAYVELMHDTAERLLSAMAVSLDLPPDHFGRFCTNALASLRLVRYPPVAPGEGRAHAAAPHTDFGGLTLLLQDHRGGLEVFDAASDGWIAAPPVPGSLVVNLGDLMARWTNDRYRSTLHRAANLSGEARYSAPFFYSGAADHPIACLPGCLEPGTAPRYRPTTVEAHLRERFEQTYAAMAARD
jgi:isopenicillin N synthase-like dioxygenase